MLFLSSFVATVFILLNLGVGNCFQNVAKPSPKGDLAHHGEVHRAKNLIDALALKLRLNVETFQSKSSASKQESLQYQSQANTAQSELNMLNQLKKLLNSLSGKSSNCEKMYLYNEFTTLRSIIIKTGNSALPKGYTVKLKVNHRRLIDSGLALNNGDDLRVFYQNHGKDRAMELDRVLENIGMTNATVLFKLQEAVKENTAETSTYVLASGNKIANRGKRNPENVYLFYDDFSDSDLKKKWTHNWGRSQVKNGKLELDTTATRTGGAAEVAIFVKEGRKWGDIEVVLDMVENNKPAWPGPFLRVEDARVKNTSAWWFEYVSIVRPGTTTCSMSPSKNNKNNYRLYRGTLAKPFRAGTWIHAKYRVVGDRFSHWVNSKIVHDNVKVSSTWMISQGTLGLGCYKNSPGCHTYYDNIKVTKYVPSPPTLSLGTECKVDWALFNGLGTSQQNPATSCRQIHDISLYNGQHRLKNGVYWIKTAADSSVQTYCDLVNGGWTLVGKVSGKVGNIYKKWLVTNQDVKGLSSPVLPSSKRVSCIDARYLATYHASTVMFASGENSKGIGAKWVQWSLPAARESTTLWNHSMTFKNVSSAPMEAVKVISWNGDEKSCYQNKFGITPYQPHGGSYPATSHNTGGSTGTNDICMAVGVLSRGTVADGWSQNGNGYDSPKSNTDWPNPSYNHGAPFLTVWLK